MARMGFLEAMNEEELEALEKGGGLKVATLAGRQRVFDHFADHWDKVGWQPMEEAFKTSEGRSQFTKHMGRFVTFFRI